MLALHQGKDLRVSKSTVIFSVKKVPRVKRKSKKKRRLRKLKNNNALLHRYQDQRLEGQLQIVIIQLILEVRIRLIVDKSRTKKEFNQTMFANFLNLKFELVTNQPKTQNMRDKNKTEVNLHSDQTSLKLQKSWLKIIKKLIQC